MLSPGHEPNEFVEADGTVSILVNHLDQFLRIKGTNTSVAVITYRTFGTLRIEKYVLWRKFNQGSLHSQLQPTRETCLSQDSNPGCLRRKELSRQLINNFSKHLHEASAWLPQCMCLTHVFNTCTSIGSRPNSRPSPSSTRALKTDMPQSGFEPDAACTVGEHSSKELCRQLIND
jgi:hypothetical protein